MKLIFAGLTGLLLLVLPTLAEARTQPDVEAFGRLQNLSYDPINDPDDLLGYGWITARFKPVRILRGRVATPTITVRYLAHTYWSEDRLIRLRLRPRPSGIYVVCAERDEEGLKCSANR